MQLFADVDLIIHAGDIGNPMVLETLQTIAKVYAVRGNVDVGELAANLPKTDLVKVGEFFFYVLHDINELNLDPAAAGLHGVISGHSHRAKIEKRDGVLFLNPGSAGPKRFQLPATLAFIYVKGVTLDAEVIEI
ncbi:MAG: metallophosphatase family protein [Candidatus Scalindua sp.]|nr:metallophosphatase family protein [Candidatus Scalindua sp.]